MSCWRLNRSSVTPLASSSSLSGESHEKLRNLRSALSAISKSRFGDGLFSVWCSWGEGLCPASGIAARVRRSLFEPLLTVGIDHHDLLGLRWLYRTTISPLRLRWNSSDDRRFIRHFRRRLWQMLDQRSVVEREERLSRAGLGESR